MWQWESTIGSHTYWKQLNVIEPVGAEIEIWPWIQTFNSICQVKCHFTECLILLFYFTWSFHWLMHCKPVTRKVHEGLVFGLQGGVCDWTLTSDDKQQKVTLMRFGVESFPSPSCCYSRNSNPTITSLGLNKSRFNRNTGLADTQTLLLQRPRNKRPLTFINSLSFWTPQLSKFEQSCVKSCKYLHWRENIVEIWMIHGAKRWD